MNNLNNKNIGVIGLGKLGSCFATSFAYRGFNVMGLDINEKIVNDINNYKAPFLEPNLDELIKKSENKLKATNNPKEIFDFSDISLLLFPLHQKRMAVFLMNI